MVPDSGPPRAPAPSVHSSARRAWGAALAAARPCVSLTSRTRAVGDSCLWCRYLIRGFVKFFPLFPVNKISLLSLP